MKITRRPSSKVMAAVGGANSTGKFKWETTRTANTAKQYGIYDNLLKFSNALVQNEYIVDVDFDIDNIFEDAPLNSYICVLVQYSEDVDWKTFSPYKDVKPYVLRVAGDFGLRRTEDRIEDYGTWMYFVLKGAANSLYVADGSVDIDAACGKRSIKSSRRKPVKASQSSMMVVFQSFLSKVDKEVSDALYQYGDARWDVKGTMSSGDGSYWFELNLWCDGEEAGTVNIEVNGDTYSTSTDAYVVSTDDSDTIQDEGNSFDDIYDTCVSELIRLAEDYENFVRTDY